MPSVLSGSQDGMTVDEIILEIADSWGAPSGSNRFKNLVKRRINRALRMIWNSDPKLRVYRVYGAPAVLQANVGEYNVTDLLVNGGFEWTDCAEVETLVFNVFDNRPLERLEMEQWRERSELLSHIGSPESWVSIDQHRIVIFPTPDEAYEGVGDYWRTIPSISTGQLEWPRAWDEAVMAGVDYLFARVKLRDRPGAINEFRTAFYKLVEDIETWDKNTAVRPFRAQATRYLRSRRDIPTDNSTDLRFVRGS
jgi:hypothetical protein